MQITIGTTKVEIKYWESPDGSQKRYYLLAAGNGHNQATWNVNAQKFEYPRKAFSAMNPEFATECKKVAGF